MLIRNGRLLIKNLTEEKAKQLLVFLLLRSNKAVRIIASQLPVEKKTEHCVICHSSYDEVWNRKDSCFVEHEWNMNGRCKCSKCDFIVCKDGFDYGKKFCYEGYHVNNKNNVPVNINVDLCPCSECVSYE